MNAHNYLLALLLMMMALHSCESPVSLDGGHQALAVATIYLNRHIQYPVSLQLC